MYNSKFKRVCAMLSSARPVVTEFNVGTVTGVTVGGRPDSVPGLWVYLWKALPRPVIE